VIDQLELVAFPCYVGVLSRDAGKVRRELHVAGKVTPYGDIPFGELLDFALSGPQDMDELNDYDRRAFHVFHFYYAP
jgi:hypothetical protein